MKKKKKVAYIFPLEINLSSQLINTENKVVTEILTDL